VGRITAGQTWTTFTDPSAVPQTLDFEGAISNVNLRHGLIRYDQPLRVDGLSLALAVEDSQQNIEAPTDAAGEARPESPDVVSRLRLQRDWGNVQAAFLLRKLGFQPTGEPVIRDTAWGMNFAGSVLLVEGTRGYYQITFGDGIGSYRGSPDVVSTGPDTAAILPMFGWMLGIQHEWNKQLTSNFTFSELYLGDVPGQSPDNLLNTTYLAINLIGNPYDQVFCGIEYLYGVRENVDLASADAHRIQTSFGFYLP
jgi:hypothetical protein